MFMEKITRDCADANEATDGGEGSGKNFKPRRFERRDVRCPVRVRIGNRQYAAYLDNASTGGVKLSTGCRIIPADKVIPEFDKDRKHSTDYYRETAVPKYGAFSKPFPEDVEWPTLLPAGALKPLS